MKTKRSSKQNIDVSEKMKNSKGSNKPNSQNSSLKIPGSQYPKPTGMSESLDQDRDTETL